MKKICKISRNFQDYQEIYKKKPQEGYNLQIEMSLNLSLKSEVTNMPPGLQISEVSDQAGGLPACWSPRLVLAMLDYGIKPPRHRRRVSLIKSLSDAKGDDLTHEVLHYSMYFKLAVLSPTSTLSSG